MTKNNEGAIGKQQQLFYAERFLEKWAGSIITNPIIALVELVANCWDAYATEVKITWPNSTEDRQFSIKDNGVGMTLDEFQYIWRMLAYNRVDRYGNFTDPPAGIEGLPRAVFGRNGKGRFASFCFSNEYIISSRKNGQYFSCRVYHTSSNPLIIEEIASPDEDMEDIKEHGTEIKGSGIIHDSTITEKKARELLGGRFLVNPEFRVYLDNKQITFNDISDSCLSSHELQIENIGKVKILHIDPRKADKTTKQHGIAWWVLNRAVGECKWHATDWQKILDGRSSEAKRCTFIVQADFLHEKDAVKEDWSWFKEDNETWKTVRSIVQDKIKEIIYEKSKAERESKRQYVMETIGNTVNTLSPFSRDRVKTFINEVVDNCPNFGQQEIVNLSAILAKLEKSKSRYGLLELLSRCDPHDLDALYEIMSKWTIGMAKIALDEIQNRLQLIKELETKIQISGINEVHELQPLFSKGLWMFGAEFESIEFTSNQGMTTVIRELFKDKAGKGSRNRPDFVVLPNSNISFHARPSFDSNYDENGIAHVVIIDLKTTAISLGAEEKNQVWKYVKELKEKGYIKQDTKVDGFILGSQIEPNEQEPRLEGSGKTAIANMLYETVLARAKSRLLNLYSKVRNAPFLVDQEEELTEFYELLPMKQNDLFMQPPAA